MFVASAQNSSGLFSALGIDWRTLLLYSLAFLVIAWLLDKFVFPVLIKALDNKKAELETADRLKAEAKHHLAEAKESALQIITDAHDSAEEVMDGARQEAAEIMKTAKAEAADRAQRLVAEAHQPLSRDVLAARRGLKQESADLVADAAGVLLGEKLSGSRDSALISRALETER